MFTILVKTHRHRRRRVLATSSLQRLRAPTSVCVCSFCSLHSCAHHGPPISSPPTRPITVDHGDSIASKPSPLPFTSPEQRLC
ncbi:hypothetical protein OG21DRAFT_321305 [Imleria badia]|nr:hypothetical protein OG21DRAFT_321305 [Imleria badia]